MHPISWLSDHDLRFPPIEQALAEPDGLLAVGGDLEPERLVAAYYEGIFPWYEAGGPILWWSPDPRMVMAPRDVHLSRSLRRHIRRQPFTITMDSAFPEVIRQCAGLREHREGTWITTEMQDAYVRLHELGYAHSVEVFQDGRLSGGLYGISIGPMFFGESMFALRDNASKVAFLALARQLDDWGFKLIDCQMPTSHLATLGARPMARSTFKHWLWKYREQPTRRGFWRFELDIPRLIAPKRE
ncbi:MAG: leucyl/phenylalanyl-tRNA--protein transferase [Pseudohongiellaceae bacterium]